MAAASIRRIHRPRQLDAALGDAGAPLSDAVDAVEAYYRARGLPPRFAVPRELDRPQPHAELTAELDRRDYGIHTQTFVMVADTTGVTRRVDGAVDPVPLLTEPDDDWYGLYRYRGQDLPPVGRRLLVNGAHLRFAALRVDGVLAGVGRVDGIRLPPPLLLPDRPLNDWGSEVRTRTGWRCRLASRVWRA